MNRFYPRLLGAGAVALALGGCSYLPWGSGEPVETGYVIESFESKLTGGPRRYGVYIPEEYNRSGRKWPMILFLHGAGERGDNVDLVLKHGPLKEAMMRGNLPFIVVAPQCPATRPGEGRGSMTWTQNEEDLLKILSEVKRKYRVDERRMYLTGLSLGGFGSFYMAAEHPGLFAAVAPICGGGDVRRADKYIGTPFWVFHGMKDAVVPPNRSVEMVDTMKAFGHEDVKITLYPDAGHDSWTETYGGDELYSWFLSHRLEKTD